MPTVSIEVKLEKRMEELLERLPEEIGDRLAKIERVLAILCDREKIEFNPKS